MKMLHASVTRSLKVCYAPGGTPLYSDTAGDTLYKAVYIYSLSYVSMSD